MAKVSKAFVRKDLAMADRADFYCARRICPWGVPTTGTHHEIDQFEQRQKTDFAGVSIVGKRRCCSAIWYYGFIPHMR
jgi:hypothetical protein